jgi:uncharacterized protein (DUF58 family)
MSNKKQSDASEARRAAERVRRISIGTRRLSSGAFQGGVQSRFRGRGMDFDEVREYTPGDDVRDIDWNATARSGHTFVKKYREERQLTVIFVVDLSGSGALGSGATTRREQAVEIASVLALAAIGSDHRIGLVTFSDRIESFVPPARGRQHALRLVNGLIDLEPAGRCTDLALALRFVREHQKRRAVVVLLSDFLLSGSGLGRAATELKALALRHDVAAIRVGDALDRELPSVGLLTVEDAETGEILEIDSGNRKQRERLSLLARQYEDSVRAFTRRASVDLLELDTLKPYLGPLSGFFRSRAGRA